MCTYSESKDSIMPAITSFVVLFVNDTLVFLAISFRLSANAVTDESWRSRFLSIVKGKGLYRLSRSLLISGQIYYLWVLCAIWASPGLNSSPNIKLCFQGHYHFLLYQLGDEYCIKVNSYNRLLCYSHNIFRLHNHNGLPCIPRCYAWHGGSSCYLFEQH